jgi:hypothetical protein
VSFEVTGWPLPDDIDRYRQTLKIPADAIIRDVARLVTVVLRGSRGRRRAGRVHLHGLLARQPARP